MSGQGGTKPDAKEIKDSYDYLFRSSTTLSKIKDAALGGRLFDGRELGEMGVAGRSLAWKLFLIPSEPLQSSPEAIAVPPIEPLRASRLEYKRLLLERMRAPDGSYEDGLTIPGTGESPPRVQRSSANLDRNNPLSLHDENPWTQWFANVDLRKTILQDVERTFPDITYFRDQEVQTQLTNILFVYSVTHPDVGYRQGMHELLAPLYCAVDYDSISQDTSSIVDAAIKEVCSNAWVAADAWALFVAVMQGVGRWYEWRESKELKENTPLASHVQLNITNDYSIKPYVAPIVQACNRIQGTLLKNVDPQLWRSLQNAGIEPQIYGIRWLRLLFTREFNMRDAMILWDALFACDPTFDLAQWVCVAMLLRVRNQLIPSDYSTQLTYLLRYPSPSSISTTSPETLTVHSSTLLIRQALTLQMSPTSATGVSVIYENRNVLNIPVEVPEVPPPPTRRRVRVGERGQSVSSSEAGSSRLGVEQGGSRSHSRQGSTPMGYPEMIARGLLERGESLGINKTVMNAVSELKRNLPDLATSLARQSPVNPSAAYADYPLVDERPPSERPPWEPRTRFEMERDVSELRSLQRRLGESLGWIVDTLLLDESDRKEEEELKKIRDRKREALESLAYVRDVLKGTVSPSEVEEERLISEEEAKKRREKAQREKEEKEAATVTEQSVRMPVQDKLRAIPTPPLPAAAASPLGDSRIPSVGLRDSSPYFTPIPRAPSSSMSIKPPIQVPRQLAPSPIPSAPVLTPNTNSTPLAPWNYTRSNFSSTQSSLADLPRPPPRLSTSTTSGSALRYGAHRDRVPMMGFSATQIPPSTDLLVSRDQAPRRGAQHDPLGVLP